jgi:hypothetical protein
MHVLNSQGKGQVAGGEAYYSKTGTGSRHLPTPQSILPTANKPHQHPRDLICPFSRSYHRTGKLSVYLVTSLRQGILGMESVEMITVG